MKVILSFTLVPVSSGLSISPYVALCQNILSESGLSYEMHANGTNIEGEWADVFAVVEKCHQVVHEAGAQRIFTTIQLGTRTDKNQNMSDKTKSVMQKLKDMQ